MYRSQIVFIVIFFLFNLTLSKGSLAQSTIDNTRANQAMSQLSATGTGPGSSLYEFASPDDKPKILGDTYHDIHWAKSSILFWDSKLFNGYLARYDIRKNEFDIKTQNGVRVIDGSKVKNFVWIDSLSGQPKMLVNTKEFFLNNKPFDGMSESLVEGKNSLFKKTILDITPPTFNSSLNVGSKDYIIVKKIKFYFSLDNNMQELKKRQALKSLQVIHPDLENFCKKEAIDWTKEDDLVKLFKYLNSK